MGFLIEIIQRLMPNREQSKDERMQVFYRLAMASEETRQYLPENFDPDKELKEVHVERYGSVD